MSFLRNLDDKLQALKGKRKAVESGPAEPSELASTVPLLLGAALLAATFVLLAMRYTSLGQPTVVVFDIIKYGNAQRAVASRFLGGKMEEAAPLLLNVSQRTRETISDVAGPGTLVVIRQAVVRGEMRDITDEVLQRLGLPTDVPTADGVRHVIDIAPTLLGSSPTVDVRSGGSDVPSDAAASRLLP